MFIADCFSGRVGWVISLGALQSGLTCDPMNLSAVRMDNLGTLLEGISVKNDSVDINCLLLSCTAFFHRKSHRTSELGIFNNSQNLSPYFLCSFLVSDTVRDQCFVTGKLNRCPSSALQLNCCFFRGDKS